MIDVRYNSEKLSYWVQLGRASIVVRNDVVAALNRMHAKYISLDDTGGWYILRYRWSEFVEWLRRLSLDHQLSYFPEALAMVQENPDYHREGKFQRTPEIPLVEVQKLLGIKAFPFQEEGILWGLMRTRMFFADATGLGKEQPTDTKVLTSLGWRELGALTTDHTVIGSDGQPKSVVGIYPQGIKPIFRLTFSDHSSVEAGLNHLWTMLYRVGGRQVYRELTLTTAQLIQKPKISMQWPDHRPTIVDLQKTTLYLPLLKAPVQFEPCTLPLPAYILGQLVANGYLHGTGIALTCNNNDWGSILSSLQKDLIQIGGTQVYGGARRVGLLNIRSVIHQLGLNVKSREKKIPEVYLRAAVSERIALLQGLMDGDGSISKIQNRLTYSTTNPHLASQVQDLVEGLGGIASSRPYDRTAENKPLEYQVRIRLPRGIEPFRVPRKAERYKPGKCAHPVRTLVSVTYTREAPSVCIAVDASDYLYTTEHCILTHNTLSALAISGTLLHRDLIDGILIICKPTHEVTWAHECRRMLPSLQSQDVAEISTATCRHAFEVHQNAKILVIPNNAVAKLFASYRDTPVRGKLSNVRWKCYVDVRKAWAKQNLALIIDEASEFRNTSTTKWRALEPHVWAFTRRIFLSATPAINDDERWWGPMHLLDRGALPMSEEALALRVGTKVGDAYNPYKVIERDPQAILEIQARLAPYVIRRMKEDCPELLHKLAVKPVFLRMSRASRLIYAYCCKTALKRLHPEGLRDIAQNAPYVNLAVDNPAMLRGRLGGTIETSLERWGLNDDTKTLYLDGYLKECIEDLNEKVVVYDTHPDTINALALRYQNYNPIIIHGSSEKNHRAKIRHEKIEVFNDLGSQHRLILLSAYAGGMGLNLQYGSRRLVFFTLPWNAEAFKQAVERVWRIGSIGECITQILCYVDTLDMTKLAVNLSRANRNDTFMAKGLTLTEIEKMFTGVPPEFLQDQGAQQYILDLLEKK